MQLMACISILCLGLVVGLIQLIAALVTTSALNSADSVEAAELTYRQFECIEKQIRARVPEHSAVFVAIKDPLWSQRLSELAAPHREVIPEPRSGSYALSLSKEDGKKACGGATLKVREQ